jgi:hypothetical protein
VTEKNVDNGRASGINAPIPSSFCALANGKFRKRYNDDAAIVLDNPQVGGVEGGERREGSGGMVVAW